MREKAAYAAFGIRPEGSSFTVEILGYQTLAEAASLARHFAGQWQSTVHLYRVPFLNTGPSAWALDKIEFVNKFTCEREQPGRGEAKSRRGWITTRTNSHHLGRSSALQPVLWIDPTPKSSWFKYSGEPERLASRMAHSEAERYTQQYGRAELVNVFTSEQA
jgi:hypothetical protein